MVNVMCVLFNNEHRYALLLFVQYCKLLHHPEAPVPLMVAVTCENNSPDQFLKANALMIQHLLNLEDHYLKFCRQKGLPPPTSDEKLFSFGEISRGAVTILKDLLLKHTHPIQTRLKKVTPGGIVPRICNSFPSQTDEILEGTHAHGNGAFPDLSEDLVAHSQCTNAHGNRALCQPLADLVAHAPRSFKRKSLTKSQATRHHAGQMSRAWQDRPHTKSELPAPCTVRPYTILGQIMLIYCIVHLQ